MLWSHYYCVSVRTTLTEHFSWFICFYTLHSVPTHFICTDIFICFNAVFQSSASLFCSLVLFVNLSVFVLLFIVHSHSCVIAHKDNSVIMLSLWAVALSVNTSFAAGILSEEDLRRFYRTSSLYISNPYTTMGLTAASVSRR